jgi:hypothetical protein
MAGPHVAGAIALLIDAFPDIRGNPDTIEYILEQSAIFLDTDQSCDGIDGTETPNNTYGYGRLDVLAAINLATLLPLNIISFEGEKINNNKIKLFWNIESNYLDKIELQRSNDATSWKNLTNIFNNNTYTDNNPKTGINFYRLKLISKNEEISYSKIISFSIDSKIKITNYPTVLKSGKAINILFEGLNTSKISLDIFNYQGQIFLHKLYSLDSDFEEITVPTNNLNKGVYIIKISNNTNKTLLTRRKIIIF